MQKQQNVLILLDHMLPMQCLVKSFEPDEVVDPTEDESEVTDEPAEEEPSAELCIKHLKQKLIQKRNQKNDDRQTIHFLVQDPAAEVAAAVVVAVLLKKQQVTQVLQKQNVLIALVRLVNTLLDLLKL